jgi:hypothetical protein
MNKFILIILCFVFFACAKPNYQSPLPPPATDQKQEPPVSNEPPVTKCKYFFEAKRLCLDFKWLARPSQTQLAELEFKFFIQERPTEFIDPALQPFISLWMPSMGHGSRPVVVEKTATGVYKASKIFFIMPGEWEIRFQLKEDKDVVDQVIEKITL